MRKAKARWGALLLFLLLFVVFAPSAAHANPIDRLYVWDDALTQPGDDEKLPIYAIQWFKRGASYYLFLPATMDASNLRVRIQGMARSFTHNGLRVGNYEVTDVFVPGQTVVIKNDADTYNIIVMQSANLPSVHVRTRSGSIAHISESKKNTERGDMTVLDAAGGVAFHNAFEYIRVRGNASFYPYKKSFHIKLNGGANLLDMGKSKTWLLIANYSDNSLLRNAITLDMAAAAGMPYTCAYRFADVYVNTNYMGNYLLSEKVQTGNNRVDIAELEKATDVANTRELSAFPRQGSIQYNEGTAKYFAIENDPEDITGGYLLQLELTERYRESVSGFVSDRGQSVLLKEPEYATQAQAEYISALYQRFENAVSAPDGIDPADGLHYTQLADMPSLVGKYLIEEISKNLDANKSSFYLYKPADAVSTLLHFGPVWDYDNAYGNYKAFYYGDQLTQPDGLFAATDDYEPYYLFPRLYAHEDFRAAAAQAYAERFLPCLQVLLGERESGADTGALRSLSEYEAFLTASAAMNFTRWRTFNDEDFPVKTGADYPQNIAYLRAFLAARTAYLSALWGVEATPASP